MTTAHLVYTDLPWTCTLCAATQVPVRPCVFPSASSCVPQTLKFTMKLLQVTVKTGRLIGQHAAVELSVRRPGPPEHPALDVDEEAALTSDTRDCKEVELIPDVYSASAGAGPELFNVLDKIFVAAHINACLAEISGGAAAVPPVADPTSGQCMHTST